MVRKTHPTPCRFKYIQLPAIMAAISSSDRSDRFDVEVVNQHLGDARRQEARQGRPKADAFDAQKEQGQKDGHGLLFVPGDIKGNGQLVDVGEAKDLLQLQGDDRQGIGIVALAGVEHPGNAADIAEIELVVAVLGAAGGEDDRVLRQVFGHFGKIAAGFLAAVAAGHDDKALDRPGLDRLDHLVGQGQHLVVGEAADDCAGLEFRRRFAGLGLGDEG